MSENFKLNFSIHNTLVEKLDRARQQIRHTPTMSAVRFDFTNVNNRRKRSTLNEKEKKTMDLLLIMRTTMITMRNNLLISFQFIFVFSLFHFSVQNEEELYSVWRDISALFSASMAELKNRPAGIADPNFSQNLYGIRSLLTWLSFDWDLL